MRMLQDKIEVDIRALSPDALRGIFTISATFNVTLKKATELFLSKIAQAAPVKGGAK